MTSFILVLGCHYIPSAHTLVLVGNLVFTCGHNTFLNFGVKCYDVDFLSEHATRLPCMLTHVVGHYVCGDVVAMSTVV